MKIEDYNEYYIQGSDHYLIPKDVFIELFNEMVNWREEVKELKKQLEEKNKPQIFIDTQDIEERYAEGLYQDYLEEENKKIKKQLTTYQILHRDCKVDNLKNISKIEEMENQQKEFISYLNNEKDRLSRECSQIYEDSLGKTRLVNEDIFNELDTILSKYIEIIGDDINGTN